MTPFIAPSILSADFARLGEEVDAVIEAGADMVHFDVMDNHFVPNLTVGPLVCAALRKYGIEAPIDVHLMIRPVDRIIPDFAAAGATYITFHPEASDEAARTLDSIRGLDCKAGIVLNPETPLDVAEDLLGHMDMLLIMSVNPDMLLIMSVNPGFGGQEFIPETFDKLRAARRMIDASGRSIRLEVDGGVKIDNIGEIAAAGADTFVAGSAVFRSADYTATIAAMRKEITREL